MPLNFASVMMVSALEKPGVNLLAFSSMLGKKGYKPVKISTESNVHIEKVGSDFTITKILLVTRGEVPDIDKETFLKIAMEAKVGCPVSKALAATNIELEATLL